jgi:hypothetical protein
MKFLTWVRSICTYIGTKFLTQVQIHKVTNTCSYPSIKCTQVHRFLSWYKVHKGRPFLTKVLTKYTQVQNPKRYTHISNTGTKFLTKVQSFLPRYKVSYPGTKFLTEVQSFLPRYKVSYPGTKFLTEVQSFLPRYKYSYPGTNILTQVQIFLPRIIIRYLLPTYL